MREFNDLIREKSISDEMAMLFQHAITCSPFLKRLLQADPMLIDDVAKHFRDPWNADTMGLWLDTQTINDSTDLQRALRKLRQCVMARLIMRDLSQVADLNEVMTVCSDLAEVSIRQSIRHQTGWLAQTYGLPSGQDDKEQQLIVVGMGKLGGRELNVSSDIDLIFAYEQDGLTTGPEVISNQDFFTKLAKKLIAMIDEITADGFVFRVDMRLRPYGSEGPLVCSFNMLEEYYQNLGREWERYAWIKGRVVAGNDTVLTAMLRPFIYRKYMDYGAIASMRELKTQIQQDVARRDIHQNIKLGRGGIREIEFIAQVFQLMRGGQDASLQIRPTVQVLDRLAQKQWLEPEIALKLKQAYELLRNLEHRLQYYNDAQTHDLPIQQEHQAAIALAMQHDSWTDLMAVLEPIRQCVSQQFDAIFSYDQPANANDNSDARLMREMWRSSYSHPELISGLEQLGYENASQAANFIFEFKKSFRLSRLPALSRSRLDALMPSIIGLCARHFNASDALGRMIQLLETICRRASYLAFFAEYPHTIERVVTLVAASPWLANYLSQHPVLLDSLLDNHNFVEPNIPEQTKELESRLLQIGNDAEQLMNALRNFQQSKLFALAAEDVIKPIPLPKLSGYLSDLADMILSVVLKTVWSQMKERHRETPKFAVIAYGKLGSRELGYWSDLDLVFLYDDNHPEARDIYTRLGMKMLSWLSTMTSSGILYETDMQLRPDGGSGLLVSSLDSFISYQKEKAWIWEHQAITRARFAAGDQALGQQFEQLRTAILTQPRQLPKLREEITSMRKRMKAAHRYVEGHFDLKHGLGGMIDIEFIAQYLILAYSHNHPVISENRANIKVLRLCAALGLIPPELGQLAADQYQRLRRQQHAMRLQGYHETWVPEESMRDQTTTIRELWHKTFYESV